MAVKDIRDLFSGTLPKNPTLRELAEEKLPHIQYVQKWDKLSALMPGDGLAEEHPCYPDDVVAQARAARKRVREGVEKRIANPIEGPCLPELPEEEPQEVHPFSGRLL